MLSRLLRPALIGAVALALVAGGLTAPGVAQADPPRPPTSGQAGLVPPNLASDIIPTSIVIAPGAGETFQPFTILSAQFAPMAVVRRDGTLDPDNAVAYWQFSLRFPRSTVFWPPFLPEPADPWEFHLYEMPDGAITGIGVSHQGSPLYAPPSNLPSDWLQRLVPAVRGAITPEQLDAAITPKLRNQVALSAGLGPTVMPTFDADERAYIGAIMNGVGAGLTLYGAGAAIAANVIAGPCGVFVAGVLLAEMTAWLELSSIATAPTTAIRYAKAASAAFAKVNATASLVLTLDVCLAQAAAAQAAENMPLALLYTAMAGLGTAVWTVSVLRYLLAGTQAAAIAIWS